MVVLFFFYVWSCQKWLEISSYQWLLLIFFQFQIEEIDLLPQFLYSDYKWLIDFSFCAVVINVLVEIFAFFLPEIYTQELNLALVWNFLVIFFSLYPLFKKHHFRIKTFLGLGNLPLKLNLLLLLYAACLLLLKIRLRVVPHFSSGIVERVKRERKWKSPHARKGDTQALLSLRKNGGLLVVYLKISPWWRSLSTG